MSVTLAEAYATKKPTPPKTKDPRMVIDKWKRFPEKIDFSKNFQSLVCGQRGKGKSALVETIGVKHDKANYGCGKIIDLFSARDNEGLCWLRHRKFKDNALLVHGDSVKISSEWNTQKISALKLSDFSDHRTIISVPSFYSNIREEYHGIAKMTEILWRRTHWDRPWYLAIREASSLLYSRLGLGENQIDAKNMVIYALREFRHSGIAVGLDTLRLKGIDIEVRTLADYIFFKSIGIFGLPDDLRWIYRHYDLFRDLMKMPPWCFIVATQSGGLANGRFQEPYWHKQEKEDLLRQLDIDIQYGKQINFADRGNNHVSDFEHADILKVRIYEKASMSTLAKGGSYKVDGVRIDLQKRSSQTISSNIQRHDEDIENIGFCTICERMREGKLMRTHTKRGYIPSLEEKNAEK